jgi:Tn3 transposase DDE domain-containing protein
VSQSDNKEHTEDVVWKLRRF